MLSEESNLIQTMYNAFRCGMLDNPSDDAKVDWLSAFDCYGILWRQCSLNGALSDSSFQQVFREVCRSFHSSNLYEQLLFSLHTTETPDDLTRRTPTPPSRSPSTPSGRFLSVTSRRARKPPTTL